MTARGGAMGFVNLFCYAFSDLRHRLGATLLNVTAVALAAVYLLVLGFYGASIHRAQHRLLDESLPTKVVATTSNATSRDHRFTDERLAELRTLPGVKLAFPQIELNVRLSAGPGAMVDLPAEGAVPEDPSLAASRLAWGRGVTASDGRAAVLSQALFAKLGGSTVGGRPYPTSLTLQVGRKTREGREELQRVPLQVVGLLRHQSTERLFVPVALAAKLDLWCTNAVSDLDAAGRSASLTYAWANAYVPAAEERRVAQEAASLAVKVERTGEVELPTGSGPVTARVLRGDGDNPIRNDWRDLRELLDGRAAVVDFPDDREAAALASGLAPRPHGLALALLAERAAWQALQRREGREAWRVEARFADPFAYLSAVKTLSRSGYRLRPLTPVPVSTLVRYQVVDSRGPVRDDLVAQLALSQPTFAAARPHLEVIATVAGEEVKLIASDPDDPERYADVPTDGRWLRPRTAEQVVLPRSAALALAGERGIRELVGTTVPVRLRRTLGGGHEPLTLSLRVAGIVDGPNGYILDRLAVNATLWQQGKMVHSESRREFVSPEELALRAGHVRCTVFAESAEAVAGVVKTLERRGYRTESRLADQEALRWLGRVLVFVVGFFVLGCILNAAITVWITTMMNVKSKTWEVGILRAHGVGDCDVLGIFGTQGLLVGAGAFAVAVAAVWLLEPVLRSGVRYAFALKADGVLMGSPFEPSLWWLPATVLAVSVGFSLIGVLVPAVFACRLSPVEAMRRRE